jgi:hypothetical protein
VKFVLVVMGWIFIGAVAWSVFRQWWQFSCFTEASKEVEKRRKYDC